MFLLQRPQSVYNRFEELDRFFEEALSPLVRTGLSATPLRVAADWLEDEKAYTIQAELPGVSREDLKVSVENHVLTVEAKRDAKEGQAQRSFHYRRSFHLPETVDTTAISAQLQDGLLTLTMPKAEQAQPRQIDVK